MPARSLRHGGTTMIFELEEFASFEKGTQRYIRRSLDVGLRRSDAVARWARNEEEAESIRRQYAVYRPLDEIRTRFVADVAVEAAGALFSAVLPLTVFDLGHGRLPSFAAYRFLYERLIGARARPWLPPVFCAAASLPHVDPDRRCTLLESAADATVCTRWSPREPGFFPEWVEKVDATISA